MEINQQFADATHRLGFGRALAARMNVSAYIQILFQASGSENKLHRMMMEAKCGPTAARAFGDKGLIFGLDPLSVPKVFLYYCQLEKPEKFHAELRTGNKHLRIYLRRSITEL